MTSDPKKLERDLSGVCGSWWRGLNGIEKDGSENRDRADRKSRAELRRAGSVASDGGDAINLIRAYGIESFHVFLRRTQEKAPWIEPERAALAAITLAHVDHDLDLDEEVKAHTARLLGKPRSADSKEPKFAEARFKRLIRTDDPAELLPQMVRAVKILGKTAPVGELGASLLRWGPDVRKHWAFAYWQKKYVSAEPSEQTETQDAA
jgi:CRISPR type I-E-associated protein CasB/Cse2